MRILKEVENSMGELSLQKDLVMVAEAEGKDGGGDGGT